MNTRDTSSFEGSEHELDTLTSELDLLHHDVGRPLMAEATGAMHGTSRRTFLLGAGAAAAGGAVLAAVGGPAVARVAGASTRRLVPSRVPTERPKW